MNDPLPRVPSLASPLTFGMSDPKAPRTVPTENHAFLDAMVRRGVTDIRNEEPKEKS